MYDGSGIPTVTSAKISGLTPGHDYIYRVSALNRVGEGDKSPDSVTIKAAEVPGRPIPPVYVTSSSTTITM